MRRFAYFGFSFAAACLICTFLTQIFYTLAAACACALLIIPGLFLKPSVRLRAVLILSGAAVGFGWFFTYNSVFLSPVGSLSGTSAHASAIVCDTPEKTDYGTKLTVKLCTDGPLKIKTQMYIYDIGAPEYSAGDIIEFDADFSDSSRINNDETDVFTSRGIFLFARCKNSPVITGKDSGSKYIHITVREKLKNMIKTLFPEDISAFITAIVTGDKDELYSSASLQTAMERSGAAHIAAISGMHVVFLTTLLGFFIRRRRLRALVITPVIVFFMAMTGFTASVVRAGIMQIFLLLAPVFNRERDDITCLSEASFVILAVNPYACAGTGFQLSFGASLGIILFAGRIYKAVMRPIKIHIKTKSRLVSAPLHFIFSSLAATLSALIFTLPICAYYFGTISITAPATNLLILWAVSLCFSLGIIACAAGFILPAAGGVIAAVCALPAKYVLYIIRLLGGSTFSAVYTSNPAITIWLVYIYAMFLAFFIFRGTLRRMLLPSALAIISLCVIIIAAPFANVRPTLDITALDVGQGQCLVLTCGKNTAVIDCGSSSGENAGRTAGQYLSGHGRHKIDMLILTHFHTDHANGVEQLMEYTDISSLVVPSADIAQDAEGTEIISLAIERGIDVIYVTRDISVSFGGACLNIIAPMGSYTENERGLTILASKNDYDILITGDMPDSIERRLTAAFDLPDIELLIAGHHGSKYSTCAELLDTVTPEAAIISVGYNSYGHPSDETLTRLARRGIKIYRTDLIGNVSVSQW